MINGKEVKKKVITDKKKIDSELRSDMKKIKIRGNSGMGTSKKGCK